MNGDLLASLIVGAIAVIGFVVLMVLENRTRKRQVEEELARLRAAINRSRS